VLRHLLQGNQLSINHIYIVVATCYYCLPVHQEMEGPRVPKWFETEGFVPAIDPDFDSWTVRVHAVELPEDRPTGRVVCEIRDLEGVRVAVHLSVETGELVALEVGATSVIQARSAVEGPPSPISARLLRAIPFGQLERIARESLRWELAIRHHHDQPEVRASLGDNGRQLRESLSAAERPGRAGRDDRVYASLAAEYVKRLGSGKEVKELAADLGEGVQKIRNMLNEARRRKLLTRPAAGKSGGQLTEKAIALLKENDDGN
jgi:hypothetical protein